MVFSHLAKFHCFFSSLCLISLSLTISLFQRLSVQEVPPLLNGGSQQQRPIPSSSQSDIPPPQHSPGPQTFRSLAATGGAIGGSGAGSPQQISTPISVSASPNANNNTSANAITTANTPITSSTSSTVGSSQAQQTSLLLATSTSSLSPSLIDPLHCAFSQPGLPILLLPTGPGPAVVPQCPSQSSTTPQCTSFQSHNPLAASPGSARRREHTIAVP